MRFREILFVDLLGGIGDLVIALPAIHALAASHPGARLRVVTHEPGASLLRGDPAVSAVHDPGVGLPRGEAAAGAVHDPAGGLLRDEAAVRPVHDPGGGAAREAVAAALAERRPDLAVTTTRYGGIPDLLRASGARCVTDLWRGPPPDELVGARYLRILCAEGVLDPSTVDPVPRLRLAAGERADGARALAALLGPARRRPVVLIPDAGMAVKLWPERRWKELAALLDGLGVPLVPMPDGDLRALAAFFAEVGRRGGAVVGGDTGPLRVAAASGARTVALFGPTVTSRYGFGAHLQGLPGCPHRRPTAITTQVCWWHADCPLSPTEPACMADIPATAVAHAVVRSLA